MCGFSDLHPVVLRPLLPEEVATAIVTIGQTSPDLSQRPYVLYTIRRTKSRQAATLTDHFPFLRWRRYLFVEQQSANQMPRRGYLSRDD
jgi:hypothetical protein